MIKLQIIWEGRQVFIVYFDNNDKNIKSMYTRGFTNSYPNKNWIIIQNNRKCAITRLVAFDYNANWLQLNRTQQSEQTNIFLLLALIRRLSLCLGLPCTSYIPLMYLSLFRIAMYLFPAIFFVFNLLYWTYYLIVVNIFDLSLFWIGRHRILFLNSFTKVCQQCRICLELAMFAYLPTIFTIAALSLLSLWFAFPILLGHKAVLVFVSQNSKLPTFKFLNHSFIWKCKIC